MLNSGHLPVNDRWRKDRIPEIRKLFMMQEGASDMFLVITKYQKPMEEVEKFLPAHSTFLDEFYP